MQAAFGYPVPHNHVTRRPVFSGAYGLAACGDDTRKEGQVFTWTQGLAIQQKPVASFQHLEEVEIPFSIRADGVRKVSHLILRQSANACSGTVSVRPRRLVRHDSLVEDDQFASPAFSLSALWRGTAVKDAASDLGYQPWVLTAQDVRVLPHASALIEMTPRPLASRIAMCSWLVMRSAMC